MDKEKVQTDISLIDVWHKLLSHKFLIIAITLVITIIGFFTIFAYNKANATITNEFTYEFEGIDKERYPDGSIFDFVDLSNKDFLEQVKNNNNEFKDIDIDKLITNPGFRFQVIEKVIPNTENEIKTHFRIEMPIKPFGNQLKAEHFIKELHETVLADVLLKNKTLNIINYFDFDDFDEFAADLTYQNIIDLFVLQNQIITTSSKNFLANHEQVNVTINNLNYNLANLIQNYNFWYKDTVNPNQLLEEVFQEGYIRNVYESLRIATARLIEVERELTVNEELIEKLKDMSLSLGLPGNSESDVFYREIERLIIKNNSLEFEKIDLKRIVNNPVLNFDQDFENFIKDIAIELNRFVETYNLVTNEYLNEQVRYRRLKTHDYVVNKPYKLLVMTALVGMGALVLSSAFALSLKDKKELISE